LIPIIIWLAIGGAIAVYLYGLMAKEGKVEVIWILLGFLLSVLGLMAFIGVRSMKDKERDKAVDPKSYQAPEYKMKEDANKKKEPKAEPVPEPKKKEVKQIRGIPRCPECGAAISSSDEKCPECGARLKE